MGSPPRVWSIKHQLASNDLSRKLYEWQIIWRLYRIYNSYRVIIYHQFFVAVELLIHIQLYSLEIYMIICHWLGLSWLATDLFKLLRIVWDVWDPFNWGEKHSGAGSVGEFLTIPLDHLGFLGILKRTLRCLGIHYDIASFNRILWGSGRTLGNIECGWQLLMILWDSLRLAAIH